jgi:hypothetical protein
VVIRFCGRREWANNRVILREFAGTDDSTSPPSLVYCVKNNRGCDVVYAKPGDHHWVSVHHLTALVENGPLVRDL